MRTETHPERTLTAVVNEMPAHPDRTAASDQPSRSTGPRTEAGKKRSSINATRHGLSGRIVVLPTEDMTLFHAFSKEIVDSLHPATPVERELAQTVADGYWRMKRFRTVEEGMFAWGHYEPEGNFDAENENIHSAFTAAKAFRVNSKAFVNLSLYEQRIQRGIEKAMKQLKELQTEREARQKAEMAEAMRMRDYHNMLQAASLSPRNQGEDKRRPVNMIQEAEQAARKSDTGKSNVTRMSPLPYNPAEDHFVYSTEEIEAACRRRDRSHQALLASYDHFDYQEYRKRAA